MSHINAAAMPADATSLEELERIVTQLEKSENRWEVYRRFAEASDVPLAPDFKFRGPVANFDDAEGYRAMAADEQRESEALEWVENLTGDIADEPR